MYLCIYIYTHAGMSACLQVCVYMYIQKENIHMHTCASVHVGYEVRDVKSDFTAVRPKGPWCSRILDVLFCAPLHSSWRQQSQAALRNILGSVRAVYEGLGFARGSLYKNSGGFWFQKP